MTQNSRNPKQFAVETINLVKDNIALVTNTPDGAPRGLSVDQSIAVAQVQALNAIAASLLALTDEVE